MFFVARRERIASSQKSRQSVPYTGIYGALTTTATLWFFYFIVLLDALPIYGLCDLAFRRRSPTSLDRARGENARNEHPQREMLCPDEDCDTGNPKKP